MVNTRHATSAGDALRLEQQTRRVGLLKAQTAGKRTETVDEQAKEQLHALSLALRDLAALQRDAGSPDWKNNYIEALRLAEETGDREGEIICAIHLGNGILESEPPKELDEAERWYFRALKVAGQANGLVSGKCYNNLGEVETERYEQARAAHGARRELGRLTANRIAFYEAALKVLPTEAPRDRAVAENGLGLAMQAAGSVEEACLHYQEAVRYFEAVGDHHRAAGVRFNIALILKDAKRAKEALSYAQAALKGFESCGPRSGEEAELVRRLLTGLRERRHF